MVIWAPTGQGLAYISEDYNIWYRTHPESVKENDILVTFTGDGGPIMNGVPDWVYEGIVEESFSFRQIIMKSFSEKMYMVFILIIFTFNIKNIL